MKVPHRERLLLPSRVLQEIRRAARFAYPDEACGALLGRRTTEVLASVTLANDDRASPRTRFAIAPSDYLRVEREARKLGLDLLGFWHSHPDYPAYPSDRDRAHTWQGLLTVVVAVHRGEPREITAWEIPGEFLALREISIAGEEAGRACDPP